MPSRGTKYSFWRGGAGGIACVWLDLLLGLPAMVEMGRLPKVKGPARGNERKDEGAKNVHESERGRKSWR